MEPNAKIYIAGHRGMVGSALEKTLRKAGFHNIVTRSSMELDLRDQAAVEQFFQTEQPHLVFIAAGRVGGIVANNTYPADFVRDTLQIQTNVIDAAFRNRCNKLLFLGSSCIYPKLCPQPIKEEYLLTGPLEPTNEGFAVAKIAGIMMCKTYRRQYGFDAVAAMPANLYGPGDNFHPQNSHVIPGMIRRFHEAKITKKNSVTIWGSGTPLREILHVDDLADACLFLMEHYSDEQHINVGSGREFSIFELAEHVAKAVGYTGEITTDPTKPDGTPRKIMDSSRINHLGWQPKIDLEDGLRETYAWYLDKERHGGLRV